MLPPVKKITSSKLKLKPRLKFKIDKKMGKWVKPIKDHSGWVALTQNVTSCAMMMTMADRSVSGLSNWLSVSVLIHTLCVILSLNLSGWVGVEPKCYLLRNDEDYNRKSITIDRSVLKKSLPQNGDGENIIKHPLTQFAPNQVGYGPLSCLSNRLSVYFLIQIPCVILKLGVNFPNVKDLKLSKS